MMQIKPSKACRHLLRNPSFEIVYKEAVANALDAGADDIKIDIKIDSFQKPETLSLIISDNGCGFTDANYKRFSELLDVKDPAHKGVGRLAYSYYFDSVFITSWVDGNQKREFVFDDDFDASKCTLSEDEHPHGTELKFGQFRNKAFWSHNNIKPEAIKNILLQEFLPQFYDRKENNQPFNIAITLDIKKEEQKHGLVSSSSNLVLADVPELKVRNQELNVDMARHSVQIYYSVTKSEGCETEARVVTSLCIDNRSVGEQLIRPDRLPKGVNAVFMLKANMLDLNVSVDDSREMIQIQKENYEKAIRRFFLRKASEILGEELPEILDTNAKRKDCLEKQFPHYVGLFDEPEVGLVDSEKALETARDRFFEDQKKVLQAEALSDDRYRMALNQAARVLTEYILYRNLIISRLEKIDLKASESKIHDIIAPMQRSFNYNDRIDDLFNNNAWVLDDRFMGYNVLLSDKSLKDLVEKISGPEELKSDDVRPDIAIVFSEDISVVDHPVDVVIVELKKKDLGYLDNMRVLEQIRMRARRLASLYPNKIQRMWFFGVVDFENDKELMLAMKEQKWRQLYSSVGKAYYNEIRVLPVDKDLNELSNKEVGVCVTLISLEALVGDAKVRNENFLQLIKEQIRKSVNSKD